MHLANLTTDWLKRIIPIFFIVFIHSASMAQDNSPYSRYGLGDIVPNQNIVNRGMGGISAGYSDFGFFSYEKNIKTPTNINFVNPASLGSISNTKNFSNTIFDIGGETDVRSLKSTTLPGKFSSTNTLISYLQIAFPISSKKMERKGTAWAVSFGLRPVSRINYKIEKNDRLDGIDSINTLYEGSGGLNQINLSTGIKIKNFSIGVSSGYSFGNKDFSTQLRLINDTVVYHKSNTATESRFGGFFLNTGLQYTFNTKRGGSFAFGAYGNLRQKLDAKQTSINETFEDDGNGDIITVDTIDFKNEVKGTVEIPATYGLGFTYQDNNRHWLIGADFETTNWNAYSYYGLREEVQDNWTIRTGAEYFPKGMKSSTNSYWRLVKYRAGFYFGPDYIKLNKNRFNYAATLGASFPLTTPPLFFRRGELVLLNAAVEAGGRGNKQSASLRENIIRFSFGISMNAKWFQKRSYE